MREGLKHCLSSFLFFSKKASAESLTIFEEKYSVTKLLFKNGHAQKKETLLDEKRLEKEGYWNVQVIRQKWQEHLAEKADNSFQLWGVLIFQDWLQSQTIPAKV